MGAQGNLFAGNLTKIHRTAIHEREAKSHFFVGVIPCLRQGSQSPGRNLGTWVISRVTTTYSIRCRIAPICGPWRTCGLRTACSRSDVAVAP